MNNSHLNTRIRRNRVQSETSRCDTRSMPPKTRRPEPVVPGDVLADQVVELAQHLERGEHQDGMPLPLRASSYIASWNGRIGLSAIAVQTRANQATAKSSRNFTRSQSFSFVPGRPLTLGRTLVRRAQPLQRLGGYGRGHQSLLTVKDLAIVSSSLDRSR